MLLGLRHIGQSARYSKADAGAGDFVHLSRCLLIVKVYPDVGQF